jgi:hypothetical protein
MYFEHIQRWTFAIIPILKLCAFIPVWKIVVSAVLLIAAGASIPTNRKPEQLSRPCPAQYIIHTDHSHQLLNSNADTLAQNIIWYALAAVQTKWKMNWKTS